MLPSLICSHFPPFLPKWFGFCAISFEEKILFLTSSCEGAVAWDAVGLLIVSNLVTRIDLDSFKWQTPFESIDVFLTDV